MDFGRKLIQTSVSAAQGDLQETPVRSAQNCPSLGGSSDAKVTSSHFPPSKGMESISVDPPPPPGDYLEAASAREDVVTGSQMSLVSRLLFFSNFSILMEFSAILLRHQKLRMRQSFSIRLPNHWISLMRSQKVEKIAKIAKIAKIGSPELR